jgi:uncharacterized protein (DUF849 family)
VRGGVARGSRRVSRVSLSTSSAIEPDPERRYDLVAGWTELPDLVTANQGENDILALCDLLIARGVGIEAGLLSLDDARIFVESGLAPRCVGRFDMATGGILSTSALIG